MNTVFLAALLRPFALFLFLSFCLCVRYGVIWWFPNCRAKQIMLHPFERIHDLRTSEKWMLAALAVLIVAGVALLPNLSYLMTRF